jgi:maleate isomerase
MRIGLIVPSSNTVMEPDFHRHFPAPAIVSTTRIFLETVTRESELRMLKDHLPKAIQLIKTTAPDVVVFGCTSAGAIGSDDQIADMIEKGTHARPVTVLGAVMTNLQRIAPRKLAVFTPYIEDLTASIASSLSQAGYPPIKAAGMGIQSNLEIGNVSPSEIIRFVESHLDSIAPDCLFLSCTNWRAIEAIDALQTKLGIPVITSNQSTIAAVRQAAAQHQAV